MFYQKLCQTKFVDLMETKNFANFHKNHFFGLRGSQNVKI